jgi:integrase
LRDRALLIALVVQAWRLGELVGLRVEDLAEEQGHRVASIRGKGGTVLRVPLAATVDAISTWTRAAEITTGPVFVPVLRGGHVVPGAPMSPHSAWKRVGFLARKAGITRRVHPHLFRHTSITVALANGVPLHQVQDHARHRDPRTTHRYDPHRNLLPNPSLHVIAGVLLGDHS